MQGFSTNRAMHGWASLPSLLAYAAGFVTGCVRGLTVPAKKRRNESARRWAKKWQQWVGHLARKSEPVSLLSMHAAGNAAGHAAKHGTVTMDSLDALRHELAGKSRKEVWSLLGRPAACSSPGGVGGAKEAQVWIAETWYYPTDLAKKQGVAVVFTHDKVSEIEPLVGPE